MSKVVVRGMNCPVARALEIIGDRWTLLILRDLFLDGPKKFQDLSASLAGISPNILSSRIKGLLSNEVIDRRMYSEYPTRYEYQLTKKGESLRPVLNDLKEWGLKHTRL